MAWCGTFYALAFTTPQTALAVAFLITDSMGQHFYMPAMYTLAQDVAPPPMRATSAALMKIGRAHVRTPVTNEPIVCRLLIEKKKVPPKKARANDDNPDHK